MRIEEYETRRLRNDIKQIMSDCGHASGIPFSGLFAKRLYDMGWRRQDEVAKDERLNGEVVN